MLERKLPWERESEGAKALAQIEQNTDVRLIIIICSDIALAERAIPTALAFDS
jgi:hypothetical protein